MGGSILHSRYNLGLPILDQGSDYKMEFLPHRKEGKKALAGNAHFLLWAIRKERNHIVFDDVFFSIARLKSSFVSMLLSWAGCMEVEEGSLVRTLLCII